MPDLWLNLEELLDLTGWSERTIQRKVSEGSLRSRSKGKRGRNGRAMREFCASSLPTAMQIKLHRRRKAEPTNSNCASENTNLQIIPVARQCLTQDHPRVPVNEAHDAQIEHRIKIIDPLIEYLRLDSKERRREWRTPKGKKVLNAEHLVKLLSKEHGQSRATIWRWYRTFKLGGVPAMFDLPRRDKGQSRFFSQHRAAAIYVLAKYCSERLGIREIQRALARDREIVGIAESELPSYNTILSFVKAQPKAPLTLAREGERRFNEDFAPYLRRAYVDVAPNEVWVSDHMNCDVLVWDDYFAGDARVFRPRLTMILDFRTRKAVGYTFCLEGSSWTITTALRNAILRFGPCKKFYADNGKDYRKVARGASPQSENAGEMDKLPGLLERLGIRAQHCLPYHPQSKHVERSFRTMHMQFDAKFIAGYTTGNAYDRPDITRVATAEHERLLKAGRVEESPLCPASVYFEAFQSWVEQEYNDSPHGGEGMSGRSPNAVFDALYPRDRRPKVELSDVAYLFYERESRIVDSCAITLNKRRYVGDSAESSAALLLQGRQRVQVAYDKNDPSIAAALDDDGRLIATLKCEILMPQSEEAQPMIAESMAERRRMQKVVVGGIRELTQEARRLGVRTEREHLEEAAGLTPEISSSSTALSLVTRRPAVTSSPIVRQEQLHSEDIGERLATQLRRPKFTAATEAKAPPSAADIAAQFLEGLGEELAEQPRRSNGTTY